MKNLEKKLLGNWASDKRRTLDICPMYHHPKNVARKRLISKMFGKLHLKFTPKYIYSEFEGQKDKGSKYEIIDSSESAIVLKYKQMMWVELLGEEPTSEYIIATFEETRFNEYLYLTHSTIRFSECFRRVNATNN